MVVASLEARGLAGPGSTARESLPNSSPEKGTGVIQVMQRFRPGFRLASVKTLFTVSKGWTDGTGTPDGRAGRQCSRHQSVAPSG